ncbi:MAG: IS1595 family transposase [Peptostreptococcaceae bacterium]|nr:IS1595 family transposase [Peptostreptococcaceae bacterium]
MQKTDIKAIVKNLNKEELKDLISLAQGVLSGLFSSDEIKDNIKESRFSKGYECPKCQCKDVNKNGKSNGRQRYICKRCRCTFDEFTLSPFSSTKLGLDKWLKYCELMILGLSIRQCAEEVGVCVKTSFYMRHRILDVINISLKNDTVEGIVEVDEVFIRESYKGNHSKSTTFEMPRAPRKRGKGKNDKKKRGISNDQICIETAIDRKGNILMGAVSNGRITTNDIVEFFDGKLGKDITFCVDSHKSYIGVKKDLNVELKQVPRGKSMLDSVYHLQHVNSLHSAFKRWLMPFNGVSSKYISNYLAWFKFLQLSKKNKKTDRIKDMLVNVATKETCITINTIRNRYVELV